MSEKNRFHVRRSLHDNTLPKHNWTSWFAWRPVRLTASNRVVWLQQIYRRAQYKTYVTLDDWQHYEYADILGVIKAPPQPHYQGRDE